VSVIKREIVPSDKTGLKIIQGVLTPSQDD
jgi:hypothetical protein